ACILSTICGNRPKVIAGLYCPKEFSHFYARRNLGFWASGRLMLRNYLRNIPCSGRVFCGVEEIEELEIIHRQTGHLWPIPIEARGRAVLQRSAARGKIVSVGRLAPMKEYNLAMVDVVRELCAKGHNVTWTVYGSGPLEGAI